MYFFTFKHQEKEYLVIKDFVDALYGKQHNYDIVLPDGVEPLVCHTATTGMIETIGNMINKNEAKGYMPSVGQNYKFKVVNPFGYKKGERVYITEHIRLDGKVEYIVTKHKVADGENNFLNVGYIKNGEHIIKMQIDVITGEHKWI